MPSGQVLMQQRSIGSLLIDREWASLELIFLLTKRIGLVERKKEEGLEGSTGQAKKEGNEEGCFFILNPE